MSSLAPLARAYWESWRTIAARRKKRRTLVPSSTIGAAIGLTRRTEPQWASLPARALLALLAVLVALSALPAGSAAPASKAAEQSADLQEVIVILEDGTDPLTAARELGAEVTHVYSNVFTGFAGTMPVAAVEEARASRSVRRISPDGMVQAESQIIPTGVSRVGTPRQTGAEHLTISSPIDADIAVLDTGVSLSGDLNVVGGTSCIAEKKGKKDKKKKKGKKGTNTTSEKKVKNKKNNGGNGNKNKNKKKNRSKPFEDNNGHGTHTAGVAAAIDNDQGVVGVAPGARVWGVKVLNAAGSGSFSDVICGLDFVHANSQTIDVVNLSLSGPGSAGSCASDPLHQAVCNVVNAGVPVVVAAGNQGTDASTRVPGNYDEVITVSGFADSDGQPGHLGPTTCFGFADDTFLEFSNFGAAVDIAAPGDCIASLWLGGALRVLSGTSESTPHVTGAVADFIASFTHANGFRPSPGQVKTWLGTVASKPQNSAFGFTGDPDGIPEPVLWLQEALAGT